MSHLGLLVEPNLDQNPKDERNKTEHYDDHLRGARRAVRFDKRGRSSVCDSDVTYNCRGAAVAIVLCNVTAFLRAEKNIPIRVSAVLDDDRAGNSNFRSVEVDYQRFGQV